MGNATTQDLSFDAMINKLLDRQAEKFIAILQEHKLTTSDCGIEAPIDIKQAANFLHKEVTTLYSLVQKDQVPYHKKLRKLYFFKSELVQFIKEGEGNTLELEKEFLEANKKRSSHV